MSILIYTATLICATFFSAVSASQAEGLTYRDAIGETLAHSARIRVKVTDIHISDATYRQNFAGLYPEVSVNSRFERQENLDPSSQTVDVISGEVIGGASGWRSNLYLWGQYYLSHWYKKRYEAYYYEKLRDVRNYECDTEVKKLLRELTDLYGAVAEGQIKLKYAARILSRLNEVFRLKGEAFAKGQLAYEDVLKAGADVASLEKETAVILKETQENIQRLNSYVGRGADKDLEVEAFSVEKENNMEGLAGLVEKTPEYKARVNELEAAVYKRMQASNNLLPDVSLYGRYDYYGSSPNSLDNAMRNTREASYSAGVLINLPIFDGGVRYWERKKNILETVRQEQSIKAVREEKSREIGSLHAGFTELARSLKHYGKLSDQYTKMLEIARKARGLGERSLIDIMEVEKDALIVERDFRVTEHTMATYEKRLRLEVDYDDFIKEYYGDRACKY